MLPLKGSPFITASKQKQTGNKREQKQPEVKMWATLYSDEYIKKATLPSVISEISKDMKALL